MNIPNLQENVPLAPYTTFKIGGPAKYFIVAKTSDEMVQAVKEATTANIQWIVLGGGSDVLVSDKGFDGLVIKSELREVVMNEETAEVRVGSGVLLSALIPKTMNAGFAGLEYAIGVPATVGGAVWANLGARGSDIAQWLTNVTVLTPEGEKKNLTNEDCAFAYRDSIFKHEKFIIVDATFQLTKTDKKVTFAKMKELADLRKDTQDVGAKCVGCVFQNPTDQTTEAAAKLIDDLGLKGKQIGGAKVSDIHANFIINTGDATADDVVQLISYIKQQVRDKNGIQLHEEIEYIGF
jgi:UDP-N-acetylmuramate dehydrogenase